MTPLLATICSAVAIATIVYFLSLDWDGSRSSSDVIGGFFGFIFALFSIVLQVGGLFGEVAFVVLSIMKLTAVEPIVAWSWLSVIMVFVFSFVLQIVGLMIVKSME